MAANKKAIRWIAFLFAAARREVAGRAGGIGGLPRGRVAGRLARASRACAGRAAAHSSSSL
ncbi:hypothetical protein, partial [Burkholderia pseudomallei]|uniref:hypothetical protein n=1 Tax=Burkholderia pseudomallei TaxID=28450 RepID=UPI001E3159BE